MIDHPPLKDNCFCSTSYWEGPESESIKQEEIIEKEELGEAEENSK
jgi:hypothetical protein